MVKEVLEILKSRPYNAPDLFYPKYEFLLQSTELLSEVLKREWNEETYQRLVFLKELLPKQPREQGYDPNRLPVYNQFFSYMLNWFFYEVKYLPFESWSHLGKEGFDLLKILFKENQLEGFRKNEQFLKINKQCESQLAVVLKDRKVLSIVMDLREGKRRYEGLYHISYLMNNNARSLDPGTEYFKEILPIYKDVQKYIYNWGRFYSDAIIFEDWEDLREEGIELLRRLIEEDRLSQFKEDLRYKEFYKKIPVCYKELLRRDYERINKALREKSYESLKSREFLKRFIDVLDQHRKRYRFFDQYGEDIFKEVDLLLAVVMNESWSEKKRRKLLGLARLIFCAIGANYFVERKIYGILPIYECFQKYVHDGCHFFGNRRIPFKEWKDLAKEEDDLLKVLIQENKLDQFEEDPRYIYFSRKILQHKEYLMKNGYFAQFYVRDSNG